MPVKLEFRWMKWLRFEKERHGQAHGIRGVTMKIGVDYYPEHWDMELWEQDADLMKRSGVELVRMAEFAWSVMEPQEGKFDFSWLDKALALFREREIQVILCTPTNCPPLWLYEKYPEALQVGRDGKRMKPAVRGHRCYNSPVYRSYTEKIVRKMGEHYRNVTNVAAWQIDNEVDSPYCCCEICAGKFREWLKEKYGSLEAVNKAYHNEVWSGSYSGWQQIHPPLGGWPITQYNPAYMLDYQRFMSESTVEYVQFQLRLLREYFPRIPITTNTYFSGSMTDFYDLFEELDFCSYDNYPTTVLPEEGYYSHAFHLDLIRGVKRKKFWIMEQLSGATGCWMKMGPTVRPGMLKGYALQAFAHGAEAVLHFRFRTAVGGAEMFWHGLIDHSNVPGRRYAEFEDLCRTVQGLSYIDRTGINAKVALLCGFDSEYAFKLQLQTEGIYYFEQMQAFHNAFSHYGVNVDIISQEEELEGYCIVVAPMMYVRSQKAVEQLHGFAREGGIVLLTTRSGVKDENNNCIMQPLPSDYIDMAGGWVEECDAIGNRKIMVEMDGENYQGTHWCDILHLESAEALGEYGEDFYAGKPAVTRNAYGKGTVYYIGTVGLPTLCRKLAEQALQLAELPYYKDIPERVEITVREGEEGRFIFVFNNDDSEKDFLFEGEQIKLKPFEMKVVGGKQNE